jgi:outer membrane protein OmpA-like peptidoglycan-associated protein
MIRIQRQGFRAVLAVCALGAVLAMGDDARAEAKLGTMVCKRIPGTGVNLIIYSKAEVRCIFNGSVDAEQWYRGKTGILLGLDLKWNKEERIYFAILSNTVKFVPEGDFLSGEFGGAKASVALGIGVGAQILLGGNDDTIALQPAVEAGTGVGVAAGLSYLDLKPDPLNKARIVTPHGDLFTLALYSGYFDAAYGFYHRSDYPASDYFSEKAITSSSGTAPQPDAATTWELSNSQRQHAIAARKRVVSAIEDPTGKIVDAAKAQVNFDCWMREAARGVASKAMKTCGDALEVHLKTVETAVAQKVTKNLLMQPTWYRAMFDTDSAALDKLGIRVIDEVWKKVAKLKSGRIYVMGNTDRSGSTKYNLELSGKRAATVKAALTGAGVPSAWMTPVAYGEHNPLDQFANPHNALNRRVDILVEPIRVKPNVIEEEAKKIVPR